MREQDPERHICFVPEEEDAGKRADACLAEKFEELSRSYLAGLIREGRITAEGRTIRPSYRLRSGECINIDLPEPEACDVAAENIPLDILFEDEDILIVNKPAGMVVHPAPGHSSGTLVNALLYHCKGSLSGINGVMRPGIVHRIDRDTSGLLVVCKNDPAHRHIAAQLAEHTLTRRYLALVSGVPKSEGTVDAPLARSRSNRLKIAVDPTGKPAVTHWHTEEVFDRHALICCRLETGRTHQIRVHMACIGHPVLGDPLYGRAEKAFPLHGQLLHAGILGLIHPRTGEYCEWEAGPPDRFLSALELLRKRNGSTKPENML